MSHSVTMPYNIHQSQSCSAVQKNPSGQHLAGSRFWYDQVLTSSPQLMRLKGSIDRPPSHIQSPQVHSSANQGLDRPRRCWPICTTATISKKSDPISTVSNGCSYTVAQLIVSDKRHVKIMQHLTSLQKILRKLWVQEIRCHTNYLINRNNKNMAEGRGFEPRRGVNPNTLSRRAP